MRKRIIMVVALAVVLSGCGASEEPVTKETRGVTWLTAADGRYSGSYTIGTDFISQLVGQPECIYSTSKKPGYNTKEGKCDPSDSDLSLPLGDKYGYDLAAKLEYRTFLDAIKSNPTAPAIAINRYTSKNWKYELAESEPVSATETKLSVIRTNLNPYTLTDDRTETLSITVSTSGEVFTTVK